jgi:hypothetical protein
MAGELRPKVATKLYKPSTPACEEDSGPAEDLAQVILRVASWLQCSVARI